MRGTEKPFRAPPVPPDESEKLVEQPVESDPARIGLPDSVPVEERRAPFTAEIGFDISPRRFESRLEHGRRSRANYASNRKRSANRIQHCFLRWRRILQITANIFKNIAFIRFKFVSYNQKKFDTPLSFLIPSDASNLTNCSLRNRFRSTFFSFPPHRSASRRPYRSRAGHATSRCISLDDCHPAAGRRIESNEQDNETVALAIPPAPSPRDCAVSRRSPLATAFSEFRPPRKNTFPDRAKGPVASAPSARMRQKSAVHDPHRCRPLLFVPFDVQPEG